MKNKLASELCSLMLRNGLPPALRGRVAYNPRDLLKHCQSQIEKAQRNGVCEWFHESGRLKAAIVIPKVELAPGFPIYRGFVETDKSPSATKWVLQILAENKPFFAPSTMIEIPFYLERTLKKLYEMGFFIDLVTGVGTPDISYERLMKYKNPASDLGDSGYVIKPLTARGDDLKQIQQIEIHEFSRNPQFGWFVNTDQWLKHSLARRKKTMKDPVGRHFVIKKDGQVVGYFGAMKVPRYFKGVTAGMELIFHESVQGKGFSHVAFRLMLEHLLKNGVDVVVGRTSQIPILKFAKMGDSTPVSYAIRLGKGTFPEEHFTKR